LWRISFTLLNSRTLDEPAYGRKSFNFVTAKNKDSKPAAPRGKSQASATAAAILGRSPTKEVELTEAKRVKPEWQKYYQHLVDLRDQLRRQMDGLAQESAQELAGYSLHMADSGTDNFDRDFALSLLSSDQDAIYEIEEALKRIEKKTYGVCELTGKSIPKARLEAIPWTRFTVEAQAQLEKDGALKSRRLGQLGTIENSGTNDVESEEGDEPAEEGNNKAKEKE
jgi:DnaK suppressor protein